MAIIKIWSLFTLTIFFTITQCGNHLLVDKLRIEFMDLEEKLWKFVLWESPNLNNADAEYHLVRNFNAFDKALEQVCALTK